VNPGDTRESELLLGGQWLPVTTTVLFINASVERCAYELVHGVRGEYLASKFGHQPFVTTQVRAEEGLAGLLGELLPLEIPENRRTLFAPTTNPRWTAMFTSDWRGQDPHSPMLWFAQGRIASVLVSEAPHSPSLAGYRASYGERKIEMYEIPPEGEAIGHTLGVRATGINKWEVAGGSGRFPGGSLWDPSARIVRDRFTHYHLAAMCERLGLHPFDEDFYAPGGSGILVTRTDPTPRDWPRISLAQARGEAPLNLSEANAL